MPLRQKRKPMPRPERKSGWRQFAPVGGSWHQRRSRMSHRCIRRLRSRHTSPVTVTIEATIGVDGKVVDAKVINSVPMLDQAALDAVRQWEYLPSMLNGQPVPVLVTVTVKFTR